MVFVMEDINKHPVNTLEEVKKLQDLVRKLELQNQQLRNKQNKLCRKTSYTGSKDGSRQSSASNTGKFANYSVEGNTNFENSNEPCADYIECENANLSYLDEIDIIKVSDVDISDDESWLYTSPKGLTPEQKSESPYKWLRKDFDDPDNKELQLAKKALVAKLNEFDILSATSHRNYQRHTENRAVTGLRRPVVPSKFAYSTTEYVQRSVIDTRTFTKSKKRQAVEYLSSPPMPSNFSTDSEKNDVEMSRRGSDVSLDSSTGTYTLTDANDVHEVARMQEESLRLNSPVGTPKRQPGHSCIPARKFSASSRSSISDMDSTENANSPPVSCQLHEEDREPVGNSPAIIPGRLNFSDHSSPSGSPYGSEGSLDNVPSSKANLCRRSMPNLNRTRAAVPKPSKTPVTTVVASERVKQRTFASRTGASGRRSDSNLLASTKSRKLTSPTRNKFRNISHYVSPTSAASTSPVAAAASPGRSAVSRAGESASRLPAKSGLPRPARATSATRTSGIPLPSVSKKSTNEDSWSDGCF